MDIEQRHKVRQAADCSPLLGKVKYIGGMNLGLKLILISTLT